MKFMSVHNQDEEARDRATEALPEVQLLCVDLNATVKTIQATRLTTFVVLSAPTLEA